MWDKKLDMNFKGDYPAGVIKSLFMLFVDKYYKIYVAEILRNIYRKKL